MEFPNIQSVRRELLDLRFSAESELTVHLQVYKDGAWVIHTSDSIHPRDCMGYWSDGWVLRNDTNCEKLATIMVSEVEEDFLLKMNT